MFYHHQKGVIIPFFIKNFKFFALAAAGLFVIVVFSVILPAQASGLVKVTPDDTQGWTEANVRDDGNSVINNVQPDDHGGEGSLQQSFSNSSGKTDFRILGDFGSVDELSNLSFDWYRDSSSTAPGHLTPAFGLYVDNGEGDSWLLKWEGVYNGYPSNGPAVPTDTWISENLLGANYWRIPQFVDGAWVGFSGCNQAGDPYECFVFDRGLTDDWLGGFDIVGGEVGIGSGWNGSYLSHVDHITINDETYDFEPTAPVLNLQLTSQCTLPNNEGARWFVKNENEFEVDFSWRFAGGGATGNETAPPAGGGELLPWAPERGANYYFFDTPQTGTLIIEWQNENDQIKSSTKATNPEICQLIEPCEAGSGWAALIESSDQGTTKSGGEVQEERSEPASTLGSPDNTFFSLGAGGSLIVEFNGYVTNEEGADLSFHEVTNGRNSYPVETVTVQVSQNGMDWHEVGAVTNKDGGDGIGYLDFESTGLNWIKFVKITDTTDYSQTGLPGSADGYDLDAVDATNIVCEEPELIELCTLTLASGILDTVNEKEGAEAKALSFIHPAWTADIDGATWIWGDDPVTNPSEEETQTFKKTFFWRGSATNAQLDIASDNSYVVYLNGVEVASDSNEDNFRIGTQDSHDLTSYILPYSFNTLEIAVKNHAGSSDPAANPAGLLYKLQVQGEVENCAEPPIEVCELTLVSDEATLVDDAASNFVTFIHNAWDASVEGASWIWGDDPIADPVGETTQTFTKTFEWYWDVESAILDIAADNSYKVYLNGNLVGEDATENNYGSADQINVTDAIESGLNTLEIEVTNWPMNNGTTESNPAGLLYKLVIENADPDCDEPEPVVLADITICKQDEEQNALAGWQLSLLGSLVDEVEVDSRTNSSSNSVDSELLPAGNYVVKAGGTFEYRGNTGLLADARFSERLPGDANYGGPYEPWSTGNIGWLHMNSDNTVWGSVYSPDHIYYAPLTLVSDSTANFYLGDDQHNDNEGKITIQIYEGYTGLTSENGCITFEDVPQGDYKIEELLQPDWENVDGLGDVVVEEDSTFYVVNREVEDEEDNEGNVAGDNNTNINCSNDTGQNAEGGGASVEGNTAGGSADGGNAGNSNSFECDIDINNENGNVQGVTDDRTDDDDEESGELNNAGVLGASDEDDGDVLAATGTQIWLGSTLGVLIIILSAALRFVPLRRR